MSNLVFGGRGKYRLAGNHLPRCDCPDCNWVFRDHNREYTRCECSDCAAHREIGAGTAPLTPIYSKTVLTAVGLGPKGKLHLASECDCKDCTSLDKKGTKRMTSINMCERDGCGALVKGTAVGLIDIMTDITSERKGYELCPACVGDLMDVLTKPPVDIRKKAYEKPYAAPEDTDDALQKSTAEQLAAMLFQKLMKQQTELDSKGHEEE